MKLWLLFLLGTGFLPVSQLAKVGKCRSYEEGSKCRASNAFWQVEGVCIIDELLKPACHAPDTRQFSFVLVAAIKQLKDEQIIGDLWVKGSGPGLSWERPTKMRKLNRGYWDLNISYTYDSSALLCTNELKCSLNQKALEFRVYRNELGTDNMLGSNFYIRLPVSDSISGHPDFTPPPVYFFPWFDNRRMEVRDLEYDNPMHFRKENQHVSVTLFYPPSYQYNVHKRYPLVLVFGNNMKEQLIPLLESMYTREANIQEAFIASIHNSGPPPYCAYNPLSVIEPDPNIYGGNNVWKCSKKLCIECLTCFDTRRAEFCDARDFSTRAKRCHYNPHKCHGNAGALLDTIEYVILPKLSIRSLSRMLIEYPKERISVIGIDGGGLLACFAALTRPHIFKNAACLSAPFHWPLRTLEVKESREKQGIGSLLDEISYKMEVRKELQPLYATQTYFIDVGEDDNKYLPIVDAYNYSDWVVEELKKRLKLRTENLLYFKFVLGGENSDYFLKKSGDFRMLDRIRAPLQVFLKPEGGFSAEYPRAPTITGKDYMYRWTNLEETYGTIVDGVEQNEDDSVNCDEYRTKQPMRVSVSVYLASVGCSIFITAVLSAILMEIRNYNKRAAVEAEAQINSDEDLSDIELKKDR